MRSDKLRAYFRTWTEKDISVLPEILSYNIICTEYSGAQYHGLEQMRRLFDERNRCGQVISWDIGRIYECGNTLFDEWHFKGVFDGKESGYDGVTVTEFDDNCRICRLHREYEGKSKVMIYDYIDMSVHMLENMYKKRLRSYAKLGYAPEAKTESEYKTIYSGDFENDLYRNIAAAEKSVIIACSYIASRQLNLLLGAADSCMSNGARLCFITKRSDNEYQQKMQKLFAAHGIPFTIKNRLNNSFVVIDNKTVWYSSGEIFGTGEDDCVLRIEDEVLAWELGNEYLR